MRRIILMAIMLSVTVAGCNRFPDLTIQVAANLAPSDTDCSISADQDTVLLRGMYDVLADDFDYVVTPRIDSYLVDNSLDIQAQQGNFQVTGFNVTIKFPDGVIPELDGGLPNPFFVTSNAFIPVNLEVDNVSSGAAFARVIPLSYRAAVLNAVNASVFNSIVLDIRATGMTSGGFTQTSPPFSWPVDFCVGCLGIPCVEPAQLGDPVGCFPGQDIWGYCDEIIPEITP